MPTATSSDLAAAVEKARSPLERHRLPRADLTTRLKTSTLLRHALPRRAVLRRAEAKGARLWALEGARNAALEAMEAIVAGTPRSGEVSELARRRLIEDEVTSALFWQPWQTSELDERSAAAADRALSSGRPVLVSVCHLGPYFLQISPLAARGVSTIAVSGPWFFDEPQPGYWGRRLARWWQGVRRRGERLAYSTGSFEVCRSLLEMREVVLIYFDLPGSIRTDFLGKPVMLASGTCQLAHQTGALVLPLRARREGARVFTDIWDALDARDFATAGDLHEAIAAVHERSILELPEALEAPGRPGAWEGGAGPSEWALPSPG